MFYLFCTASVRHVGLKLIKPISFEPVSFPVLFKNNWLTCLEKDFGKFKVLKMCSASCLHWSDGFAITEYLYCRVVFLR